MSSIDPGRTQPARQSPPVGLLVFIVLVGLAFVSTAGIIVTLMLAKDRTPQLPGAPNGAMIHVERPADPDDPAMPDHFVTGFFIPPFDVVNQDEKQVTNAAFRDKITVIDFFFSNCPFICPAMNARFAQLVEILKDDPRVQFLSFSVDPLHDTPARLREYAKQLGADTTKWQFLSGKKDVIWNILSEGLKWGIEERPEQVIKLPTGNEMSNIRHPGWFALIGPDAKVLGIYKYDVEEDQNRLVERIRALSTKLAK